MIRRVIQITREQDTILQELRNQGYTISGYIRQLLDREFAASTFDGHNREVLRRVTKQVTDLKRETRTLRAKL